MAASIEKYSVAPSAGDKGTRYRVRYRTPEKASRKRGGFRTKAEATAFAASLEVAKDTGTYVDTKGARTTVGQWFQVYMDGLETKETTRVARQSAWDVRVKDRWADVPVGSVKPSDVAAWVAKMKRDGVGVASIEAAVLVLRCALQVAVGDRALSTNPAARVKVPRRVKPELRHLTFPQVVALVEEMPRQADATLVEFLASTGLRWGEAAALRVRSFDLLRIQRGKLAPRVRVSEAMAEVEGREVWSTPKDHQTRYVSFPEHLVEPISRLMVGKADDDLVFTAPQGGTWRVSGFRPRVFAPAVARCHAADPSFPADLTVHDLRHTAATLAISNGTPVNVVKEMLGHANAMITMSVYVGFFPDELDSVSNTLGAGMQAARAAAQDRASGHTAGTNVRQLA